MHAVDTSITQEPGLTLQFASERDFMRLIAKGRVTVYAYREDEFLALDRSHTFHATEPPAQVYELDTATIPALIHLALPAGTPQSELTWGVVLPPKVERQIRQHVDQELRGELHINRYEEVRHVAAR